jgi:Flp pilus assembly protein TadD
MRICTSLALGVIFQIGCAGLTLSPNATPARLRAYNDEIASRYVSANDFERAGKFEEARQIYQELHEKHPENPDYLHRLAVVNTRLQRYGEAANFYERSRLADPENVRLLADMGYSAYLKNDLATSEEVLRDALRIKPGNPRVINNLALVLGARGKIDECQSLLQQLGDEASALASLGYIHAKRGEMILAEARYREALAINPNLNYAKVALDELPRQQIPDDFLPPMTPGSPDSGNAAFVVADAVEDSEVRHVSGTLDDFPQQVINAAFVQPWSASKKPLLSEDKTDDENAPDNQVQKAAVFDDQEPEFSSPSIDQVAPVSDVQDDDWAND